MQQLVGTRFQRARRAVAAAASCYLAAPTELSPTPAADAVARCITTGGGFHLPVSASDFGA
jgi:hypothetical protein